MLLVLTPETVRSEIDLRVATVPRRILTLGRRVFPRGARGGLFWRTVFEIPLTRYALALSGVPIALALKPEWALAISMAPVPMFLLVLIIEGYVLSLPTARARRALIDPVLAERGLDRLKVRAQQVLTRIAAARPAGSGTLHLVIEQSELMRVPPLTYVSVQRDGPEPGFVALDAAERAMVGDTLFDRDLDERLLHRINMAENTPLRVFALDPATVSAHARLAALAARTQD